MNCINPFYFRLISEVEFDSLSQDRLIDYLSQKFSYRERLLEVDTTVLSNLSQLKQSHEEIEKTFERTIREY